MASAAMLRRQEVEPAVFALLQLRAGWMLRDLAAALGRPVADVAEVLVYGERHGQVRRVRGRNVRERDRWSLAPRVLREGEAAPT